MNVQSVVALAFSALSLYGLWLLWTWLYRDYRIDLFRDRMFSLRQDLFDLAAQGVVRFDHPAYGTLRTTMNGFIRLADSLNLTTITAFSLGTKGFSPDDVGLEVFPVRWKRETAILEPEVQQKLNRIVGRMHFLVTDQLIFTSSVLTITVLPIVVWLAVKFFMRNVAKNLMTSTIITRIGNWPWIGGIDSTAHAAGSLA